MLDIEVVYAEGEKQWRIPVSLYAGCTVLEAIQASGILSLCPQINISTQKVGIFGVLASFTTLLNDGDRVEIYRPIMVDPMQKRRDIAALAKKTKTGKKQ